MLTKMAALLAVFLLGVVANAATTIRLCVPDTLNSTQLASCNQLMTAVSTSDITFVCYSGNTTAEVCLVVFMVVRDSTGRCFGSF